VIMPGAIVQIRLLPSRNDINGDHPADVLGNRLPDIHEPERDNERRLIVHHDRGIVGYDPGSLVYPHLMLHDANLVYGSLSLFSNLLESIEGEYASSNGGEKSSDLNSKSKPIPLYFAWGVTLFGGVVLAYGWWNVHFRLDVNLKWWLILAGIGLVLFAYGVNALVDLSQSGDDRMQEFKSSVAVSWPQSLFSAAEV
jgi:hypothetical protein